MTDEIPEARDVNRDLTERLVAAGRARGFEVMTEYAIPGGRIDVVWGSHIKPPVPGIQGPVPVVAFEIESSWRTRKHVKGDLLNLLDCGVSVGVIVLADGDARDESLLRFAQALIDRPGPQVQVWTRSDVLALEEAEPCAAHAGDANPAPFAAPAALSERSHSGKYRELWEWLSRHERRAVTVNFGEIEEIIGRPLPPSSRNYLPHWYSYEGSAVARAIQDAGWKAARVNLQSEQVTFEPR